MTTSARIADILLTQKGYPGLYDWAMDQRRSVRPATWDEVALSLRAATDEKLTFAAKCFADGVKLPSKRVSPTRARRSRR